LLGPLRGQRQRQLSQPRGRQFGGRVHHQVFALLVEREYDRLADPRLVGEQRCFATGNNFDFCCVTCVVGSNFKVFVKCKSGFLNEHDEGLCNTFSKRP
jgi:hypothetical protein